MLICIPLLLLIAVAETFGLTEIFFINRSSTVRRDAINIGSAISQLDCNMRCINTPGCEGCIFYTDKGRCTLLGAAMLSPPGICPVPYTLYEKTFSGCPKITRPPVDLNYVPGPCSRVADILGPPSEGVLRPCGSPPVNQRRILLDTILHDGTRQNMDNQKTTIVDWDPYMGSWYHNFGGRPTYFKCGTCVRPPSPPLPGCECGPLPENTVHLRTPSGTPLRLETAPVCPIGQMVQILYKRVTSPSGIDEECLDTEGRSIYCAMGEWMCIIDQQGNYNEYAVVAAMCVVK